MSNLILLHIASAFLCLLLLIIRGSMQLSKQDWRAIKLLKILPHLADTLLLTTAVALVYFFGFNLWIAAKIACFVAYVFFAVKWFSKKAVQPKPIFFLLAILSLISAIYLGYSH
ncbi:SirB2 family protein [Pasteurellaceae bacterium 22721_9_1]